MTVAPESVILPALRSGRRLRLSRRWQHAFTVLGICLPVPILAATGLSIPLPATVERLAAAIAPWAGEEGVYDREALASGRSGSIVYVAGEHRADAVVAPSAAANPRDQTPDEQASGAGGGGPRAGDGGGTGSGGGGGGDGASGGAGGSTSTTPTGGTEPAVDPSDPTSPVQDAVDQAGEATQPVVDQAEGTVTDIVGTAENTVDGVVDGLGN